MANSVQRISVLTGVASAHLALLFVKVTTAPEKGDWNTQGTLVFIPAPKQPHRSDERSSTATERRTQPITIEQNSPKSVQQPAHSPEQWYDEAKAAVDSTIARQERDNAYRTFEPKTNKKEEPLYEDLGKGIFDRGPTHPVGLVQDLGEGMFRTWVTPYCYVISSMTFEGRKDKKRCAQPGENANLEDMFQQFKPKYLEGPVREQIER